MSESAVRIDVEGAVLIVTLDRPKANAVDAQTSRLLYDAFARLRDDPALRIGILTGAGDKFFSAGWDLKSAAEGEAADTDWGLGGFAGITEFFDIGKPVIAAVNGIAFAGGFELALAADIIIASDTAVFALTETRVGLVPDAGGMFRVPAILPRNIALEFMLTGRRFSADEAARLGLINRVVPAAELMSAARALAAEILESAPLSIAAVLEVVNATVGQNSETAFATLRSGLPAYSKVASSHDAKEGAIAFLEKRPPVWLGR